MKAIINKAYRSHKSMKRALADPDKREQIKETIGDAIGFMGMFAVLFAMSVMF